MGQSDGVLVDSWRFGVLRAFLFVEYVGDYHVHGGPSYLFNSGGGYRITPSQQIDFHVGIGLNDSAPAYFFGIGYSFRVDGLF
jgi:hypothetical protein